MGGSEAVLEYNPPRAAEACMILLHGLGADGGDLLPLAREFAGGALRVVCPHAPARAVTLNAGMRMRAWYDIAGGDLVDRQDRAGVEESAAVIVDLIAAERKRGFAAERIFLAGFSQGAAMALHVGARHGETLAGVVALSGYLLFAEALAEEASAAGRETPVFMGHGGMDAVVLPRWGRMSRDALTGAGVAVEYREYALLPHAIDGGEIADVNAWLGRRGAGGVGRA